MIQGRIDAVNTDSVDPQVLQERKITCACIRKGQGVHEGRGFAEIIVGALNYDS
jgi:hypothetical protein